MASSRRARALAWNGTQGNARSAAVSCSAFGACSVCCTGFRRRRGGRRPTSRRRSADDWTSHSNGHRLGALPPGGEVPEHQLITRARSGDEDAFAALVAMHSERVYGALRRFGLDAGEGEEVAQEVFLRAWRGLARFEERAQLSTWLYRIAFNEAHRRLARRERPPVSPD